MNAPIARPRDPAPAPAHAALAETAQYLSFTLDAELFGMQILSIKEIIEYGGVTPVPMMPPTIRGVINLRGAVVPVMDLAARLGRPPAAIGRRSCIVIVELGDAPDGAASQVIGLIVDAVNAVQDIAAADIEPVPGFGTRIAPQFIAGMGKVAGRFVILLDIRQTLSGHELHALSGFAGA